MELKLYEESLKEESKSKHIQTLQITDFLHEIQGVINSVNNLGGRVIFWNAWGSYTAIVR